MLAEEKNKKNAELAKNKLALDDFMDDLDDLTVEKSPEPIKAEAKHADFSHELHEAYDFAIVDNKRKK